MEYELKMILLILIGALLVGGISGLFNIIYATIFLAVLVAFMTVTFFWKDLLISLVRFISSFIFPRRWRH